MSVAGHRQGKKLMKLASATSFQIHSTAFAPEKAEAAPPILVAACFK